MTYALSGTDAGAFTLDETTGALSFDASPDFETPTDAGANNVYDITVTATDAAGNDTDLDVAIEVFDIDEVAPVFTSAATATTVENVAAGAPVYTAVATDDRGAVTYTLSGVDAGAFTLDAMSGALSFDASPDFEDPTDAGEDNVYDVTITATDVAGNDIGLDVAIEVTDVAEMAPVNTAPTLTNSGAANNVPVSTVEGAVEVTGTDALTSLFALTEAFDAEGDDLTFTVTGGPDAAAFEVTLVDDGTGVLVPTLSFVDVPDFEAPTDMGGADFDNVYVVQVTANDGELDSNALGLAVTVTNDPTDDLPPEFTSGTTADTAENLTAGTTVYTAIANDQDSADVPTYALTGGADAALFAIDATTGAVSFDASPDFEAPNDAGADNVYDIVVTATDGAGNAANQSVAITVTDVDESVPDTTAPVFTSATAATTAEDLAGGTTIYTAAATDDIGPVTYTLSGTDADAFNLDDTSGALSFDVSPDFDAPVDAGADNIYDITVTATDGAGNEAEQAVAIEVTEVAEALTVTNPTTDIVSPTGDAVAVHAMVTSAETAGGAVVLDLMTNQDDATLSFTLGGMGGTGGLDGARFNLDEATGEVSFINPVDAAAPGDLDGGPSDGDDGVFIIRVVVTNTDTGEALAANNYLIQVTDVVAATAARDLAEDAAVDLNADDDIASLDIGESAEVESLFDALASADGASLSDGQLALTSQSAAPASDSVELASIDAIWMDDGSEADQLQIQLSDAFDIAAG